jgi:hypothetical protein
VNLTRDEKSERYTGQGDMIKLKTMGVIDLEEAVELLFAGNMTRRTLRDIKVSDRALLISYGTKPRLRTHVFKVVNPSMNDYAF